MLDKVKKAEKVEVKETSKKVSKKSDEKSIPLSLIGKIVLALYVVVSIVYIGYIQYMTFKINVIERSIVEGQIDAVNQLINQVQQSNCQPIPIYNEEAQVQLIDINCLQVSEEPAE